MTPSRDDSIRQRKRKRRFKTLSVSFILIAIGLGIYGVLFSRLFCIQTIHAETRDDPSVDVEQAAWNIIRQRDITIIPKNNILFLNKVFMNARLLEEFPDIQKFTMAYNIQTQTLTLNGIEREPIGVICGIEQPCHYFDNKGILFHEPDSFVDQKIAVIDETRKELRVGIGAPYATHTFMTALEAYWNAAQNIIPIKTITIEKDSIQANSIRLNTFEGWYVLVNTTLDPQTTMQKIASVMKTELDNKTTQLNYIDARYTDKVYYK